MKIIEEITEWDTEYAVPNHVYKNLPSPSSSVLVEGNFEKSQTPGTIENQKLLNLRVKPGLWLVVKVLNTQ